VDASKYLVIALFLLSISFIGCAQDKENSITIEQLREQMNSDSSLVILDVRTEQEQTDALGHIDGVINIPVQVLESRLNELEKFKDRNIAVICRSGRRSEIATKLLLENSFKAENVLGGMQEYRNTEKKKINN